MNSVAFHAYIAGVVDSDGSFSINKQHSGRVNQSYTPIFQLTWTNTPKAKKVFDRLVLEYGGSYCLVKSSSTGYANSRPYLKYMLTSGKLNKFVADVLPYLCLKRQQAINILRLRKFTPKPGIKTKPVRIVEFQHKLYELNKQLNTKNGVVR
jgi:hypothetical protein